MSYKHNFTFDSLVSIYNDYKNKYGKKSYRYISRLLNDAKTKHKESFYQSEKAIMLIKEGRLPDHEQSWRAFKGKNMENLIIHMIKTEVEDLGLKVINGNQIERTQNLNNELSKVKRNLAIDYGEYGLHLPDVDIIIYKPISAEVVAVISSKVTLRERIAQTAYWKLKLLQDKHTENIKVFFITPDEDGTLTNKSKPKKGRAIVEVDLDGSYVLTEKSIEESDKVKLFEHFIEDLKKLL